MLIGDRIRGLSLSTPRIIVAALAALVLAGCGSSSGSPKKAATGPLAAFNACLSKADSLLSGSSANPPAGGGADIIADEVSGIAGNTWNQGAHHIATADARVMTGFPIRIVRGTYLVTTGHVSNMSELAIEGCAGSIR